MTALLGPGTVLTFTGTPGEAGPWGVGGVGIVTNGGRPIFIPCVPIILYVTERGGGKTMKEGSIRC